MPPFALKTQMSHVLGTHAHDVFSCDPADRHGNEHGAGHQRATSRTNNGNDYDDDGGGGRGATPSPYPPSGLQRRQRKPSSCSGGRRRRRGRRIFRSLVCTVAFGPGEIATEVLVLEGEGEPYVYVFVSFLLH